MPQTTVLEAQLAFLEDTVQALDRALAVQQQQLLRLETHVATLHQQLREQGNRLDAFGGNVLDPPPPHY
jgi:uncharacterized coiled-coil protein SlyX